MYKERYHNRLKKLIEEYITIGYSVVKKFPLDEKYGMTSQVKRAMISIMLNYVEGFARSKKKVMLNFYEISYGSLQESITIFYFATKFLFITTTEYMQLYKIKEEIAKMLWSSIEGLRKDCEVDM
ncbi:MAG: four helix bundle protein [Candidatus Magasanikbacteria bacterium]|nr:four helix bundle protein [Candidatus Magasanikbacteria bacterium]